MRFSFLLFLLIIFLAACSGELNRPVAVTPIAVEAIPTIDPVNTELRQAQLNYNTYCAHCHGYGGEGQPVETIELTESLGYHTVPLHNSAGHTWQHPDQILFETIKYGIQTPANLYQMTASSEFLSNEEIFAIIDYIRLWWTDEQREWQEQMTEQFAEDNSFWLPNRDEP